MLGHGDRWSGEVATLLDTLDADDGTGWRAVGPGALAGIARALAVARVRREVTQSHLAAAWTRRPLASASPTQLASLLYGLAQTDALPHSVVRRAASAWAQSDASGSTEEMEKILTPDQRASRGADLLSAWSSEELGVACWALAAAGHRGSPGLGALLDELERRCDVGGATVVPARALRQAHQALWSRGEEDDGRGRVSERGGHGRRPRLAGAARRAWDADLLDTKRRAGPSWYQSRVVEGLIRLGVPPRRARSGRPSGAGWEEESVDPGYSVDVAVWFDNDGNGDRQGMTPPLAIECDGPSHELRELGESGDEANERDFGDFGAATRPTGATRLKRALLLRAGWRVATLTHWQLDRCDDVAAVAALVRSAAEKVGVSLPG